MYRNKNGTADKRRKDNHIIWPKSCLYIGRFKVTYKNPVNLYCVIIELRKRSIEILKCDEEKMKYERLNIEKGINTRLRTLEEIVKKFQEQPTNFEIYCAKIFENMGYSVKVTPAVNDGGYDLIIYDGFQKGIVECKCYSCNNKIGRPIIQKLVCANQEAKAERMIFITTSDYTKDAIKYAKIAGVELLNGEQVISLSKQYLNLTIKSRNIENEQWWLTEEDILRKYPKDIG